MNNKAKSLFHGKEGYNCAQAVLAAFKDKFAVEDEHIASFKKYGGGRAEDGLCGAVYAALWLLGEDDDAKDILKNKFLDRAGAVSCKSIKSQRKISCADCVGLAADILEQIRIKNRQL